MNKTVTLDQFLTSKELKEAERLFKKAESASAFVNSVDAQIIRPVIERINKDLGQENEPRFLAYMVLYVFNRIVGKKL